MNHPKREEWVPYVFGEATPEAARKLKDHLQDCPECRQEITNWKSSMNRLDSWKVSKNPDRFRFSPLLKMAAAVVILVAAGFGAGRFSGINAAADRVRKSIEPQIRQELRQEFAQMLRDEMDKAESQRVADYVALKKDLDTVAVMTDAELRRAHRQLVELAGYTSPSANSRNP